MTTIAERLDDGDWMEAFGYAGEEGTCATSCQDGPAVSVVQGAVSEATLFTRANVVRILGMSEGENDGQSWMIDGVLDDNRWFYLEAGCDYTGWD